MIATVLALIFSPIGRWVSAGAVLLLAFGGIYAKGRIDGRSAYKSKIEREIKNAVDKGDAARADALRDFDASPDSLPDDGFRRP